MAPVWLSLWLLAVPATGATADDKLWARDVPTQQQEEAKKLFRIGNVALRDGRSSRAVQAYREALKHWEHPAIHFNLALALRPTNNSIEIHRHLTQALFWGPSALPTEAFEQAMRLLAQMERQLTKLRIRCAADGAVVMLDGAPLMTSPGIWEGTVLAGAHQLTLHKPGVGVEEKSITLLGGDSTSVELQFRQGEETWIYERPFSPVVSWSATAAAIVTAGLGAGLHLIASDTMTQVNKDIQTCAEAAAPQACLPSGDVQHRFNVARGYQTAAYTLYAAAGVAAIASITLWYLGRPVATPKRTGTTVVLAPVLWPSGFGSALTFEF